MITKIEIKDCASFDKQGSLLGDLKEVNFIYGANGSGKTTISNVIADLENFSDCSIEWKSNIPLKTFVYNRTFVDENFGRSRNLKGVFTLGKEETNAKIEIEKKKNEINEKNETISGIDKKFEQNKTDLEGNELQFETECWKIHTLYKDEFKEAFTGANYKNTFKDKCKKEAKNTNDLLTLDVLKEKATRIYKGSTEPKEDISLIDISQLEKIENHIVWSTRILGKEDVDIAAMIKKLNNSDWVKQGRAFYTLNDNTCPFCQQKAPANLEAQLNEYFDENYLSQISILNLQKGDYNITTFTLFAEISSLIDSKNDMLDAVQLEELKKLFELKINANKAKIESKVKEPSSTIIVENVIEILSAINAVIQTAKDKIKQHNETVKNRASEKLRLSNEIWRFICDQLKSEYQRYNDNEIQFSKTKLGLEKSRLEIFERVKLLGSEIAELGKSITSIEFTKTEINDLLFKFGFTNFKLAEANDESGSYQIVRPNGERVERTLSEGEKTFITFLYFYHLLKGGIDTENISIDRIVVFDDPISSLDSDVLFIVSHLLRELISEIRNKKGNIKQIIILTHNVYFHKEVTFNKTKGNYKHKDETFWIVRKVKDISKTIKHETNPIQTSYELLWKEVIDNPECVSIQNTLRRIIETYFKMFGGINTEEIIEKLDYEDKITANSLLSWSHAGSHGINDDLFIASENSKFLNVFRNIFDKTHHIEHYNMMMGIKIVEIETVDFVNEKQTVLV